MDYRVPFDEMTWMPVLDGTARTKLAQQDGRTIRLLELTPHSRHPDWCVTGHIGFVVEGRLEIEFDDHIQTFKAGDGLAIADGAAHRHRPRALTDRVVLFLTERGVH